MHLVVDANILFAALIRDGPTRKLWFHPALTLIAPEFLLVELAKYEMEIKKKYAGKNFAMLQATLLGKMQFVSDNAIIPFLPAAESLSSDSKDWLYLALALKANAAIWSNDGEMKKQSRVPIKNTSEMIVEFGTL